MTTITTHKPILYLASPLFTRGEYDFNHALTVYLRQAGFEVNAPQQFCHGLKQDFTIFSACMRHLSDSDIVIVNCDGPDMDSGTAFEAGWAYARSKTIISYRTDFRNGGDCKENVNLMIGKAGWKHINAPNWSASTVADEIVTLIGQLPKQLRVLYEKVLT